MAPTSTTLRRSRGLFPLAALTLSTFLFQSVAALPAHATEATVIERQTELLDEYDYIVIGAGTAGLTVADRLSENGEYTVLVVEYGYLDSSHSITAIAVPERGNGIEEYSSGSRMYNVSSVPQTGLNNVRIAVAAGAVVGGSSAVNGMFFDRGTAEDYDSWVDAAGEKHREEFGKEWGWKNILPAFKKSVTFHPPSKEMQEEYGMTFDAEAAYGNGTTPIHSSYRPFQWPIQQLMWNAFKKVPGLEFPIEGADGNAVGVFWCPNSMDPATGTRSYSKLGHYEVEGGPAHRPNFHLLPGHRVTQVITTSPLTIDSDVWIAEGVRITPRDGPMPETALEIRAKKEVVVSAGAVHTPQVLQRSGIGPKEVLEAAGVQVKVDLPGVGRNLQDHMIYSVSFNFRKEVWPTSATLNTNQTFAAEALELWKTNHTGPYSAFVNSGIFLPLRVFSNKTDDIVARLLAQKPEEFLPKGLHPTLIAGYAEQVKTTARQFLSNGSAVLEMPFSGGSSFSIVLLKILSRGTIHISPDDDGIEATGRGDMEPIFDFRAFSNPIDVELNIELLRGVRDLMASAPMVEALDPVETSPGPQVQGDEEIAEFIRRSIRPTVGHPVGSASLAPLELGGVVGPDLRVYGTEKLSVADNSIMTLLPGTHTSSTAYAIGEKAAELILRRAKASTA